MRDPERPALGTGGKNEHPTYDKVISLANDTFFQLGKGCSERVYQQAIFDSSWFSENNILVRMERIIKINHFDPPLLGRRVDLEVAGCYVFELKVTAPTEHNLKVDRLQIETYLQAYAFNNHVVHRAALIYFTPTGVVVFEVYCHWIFPGRDRSFGEPELSLEDSLQRLSLDPAET